MERLLKVDEVMERTSLGRSTVYELLASRRLPSVSIGRSRRVREADLDAFIRNQAADPLSLASAL